MTCKAIVVLPEDSGPKISTTRPRGKPPTPSAASNEIAPVEITEIGTIASFDPNRMIDPLPNCFSICETANSIALPRSSAMGVWLLKDHRTKCVETNLAELYIQNEANKRRISIINSGKCPETGTESVAWAPHPRNSSQKTAQDVPRSIGGAGQSETCLRSAFS